MSSWIKVESSIYEKTEVFLLSQIMEMERSQVLGLLVVFWTWADKNTADGKINANRQIIDAVTIEGFANALIQVGWLDFVNDGKCAIMKNYDRHNGTSAKKRATTADRVRKHRNAQPVTREEKKRKEKIKEEKKEVLDVF